MFCDDTLGSPSQDPPPRLRSPHIFPINRVADFGSIEDILAHILQVWKKQVCKKKLYCKKKLKLIKI
jgi:hypothetical protein